MELIGKDVSEQILDNLDPIDLVKFCASWKETEDKKMGALSQVCFSSEFWKRRFRKDFGFLLNTPKDIVSVKFLSDARKHYLEIFQILTNCTDKLYKFCQESIFDSFWKNLTDEYKKRLHQKLFNAFHQGLKTTIKYINKRSTIFTPKEDPWLDSEFSYRNLTLTAMELAGYLCDSIANNESIDEHLVEIQRDFLLEFRDYLISLFPAEFEEAENEEDEEENESVYEEEEFEEAPEQEEENEEENENEEEFEEL